jgi:DNA-binding transcriptional regulator LsrR (DeoR family)
VLIGYAGRELPTNKITYARRAYMHFRNGLDTADIAKIMRISEPKALHWITLGRCWERALPLPYQRKE